jgi:1L-myo-inositol 1-phosphate cytidylyltransferase
MIHKAIERPGIILAAGLGERLAITSSQSDGIKPLTEVAGLRLLMRTIDSLEFAGCSPIIIVLGWQAQTIENYITDNYCGPTPIVTVINGNYRLQNGISVLCAGKYIHKEYILTMADHVLDKRIMWLAARHIPRSGCATLCVDYKLDTIFDMQDATKVMARDEKIVKIGKQLNDYNCVDTGVFIGTPGLFDALQTLYDRYGDASLSEGVQVLASEGKMDTLDIGNAFWQDVDTPEMLAHAQRLLRDNE